jgi:hypothetical protein
MPAPNAFGAGIPFSETANHADVANEIGCGRIRTTGILPVVVGGRLACRIV